MARKGRDGQEFDGVDSERDEMVQTFNRGVERPFRRERADVHLVQDAAWERTSAPLPVRPGEPVVLVDAAESAHAGRLPWGARVGQGFGGAVQREPVVG